MLTDRLLHTLLYTPSPERVWGLPALCTGKPGVAKSSRIRQLGAKAFGSQATYVLRCSYRDPVDLGGLLVLGADGARHEPLAWARSLAAQSRGLLVLDEATTAVPAVQHVLMAVALDRCVGDYQLPPGIRIMLLANSAEDASGHEIVAPLANRVCHLDWDSPDTDAVSTYWSMRGAPVPSSLRSSGPDADAKQSGADAAAEEERVAAELPTAYAGALGLVSGYLRRSAASLLRVPDAGSPAASRAYPTPRSWDHVVCALAGSTVHGLSETERDTLVAGFVGAGESNALAAYAEESDLPDPIAVLDGEVSWQHDGHRLDRTLAVLTSVASIVAGERTRSDARVKAAWKMLAAVLGAADDTIIPAATTMCAAKLHTGKHEQAAQPVLAKLLPTLRAGGLS